MEAQQALLSLAAFPRRSAGTHNGTVSCLPGSACCVRHPRVPSCVRHHHLLRHAAVSSGKVSAARRDRTHSSSSSSRTITSGCSWASGCCRRKPTECRDASHLRFAPRPAGCGAGAVAAQQRQRCCTGVPVHTRIGKTGSKSTILQLTKTPSCAQTSVFHDVLIAQLPPTQAKLTVMREPCDRARSLVRHFHEFAPAGHPVHGVRSLAQLARFLAARWDNVTRRPWPKDDPDLHHYIVAWPQAWYVDECTDVLCYTSHLRAPLQAYCAARGGGGGGGGGAAAVAAAPSAAADSDAEGCAAVRKLYETDWELYQRHCLRSG